MEIYAARHFNLLFVWLDLGWLALFCAILVFFKKYQALLVGLAAGVLYMIVDYGIFRLALGTREVTGADPFWLLFWMSMSYGLTNFAWIWLLFEKNGHEKEWSVFIFAGWLAVALLSTNFGHAFPAVTTFRATASYHGVMALLLFVGYGIQIVRNLRASRRGEKPVNLLWLLAIGIGVQLAWEGILLLAGIRPLKVNTLIVNSLLETNLGIPYAYWIFCALNKKKKSLLP